MSNYSQWVQQKLRLGWAFLAAGVIVAAAGAWIGSEFAYLPYNFRIITGLGILLAGVGFSFLVRYWHARKNGAEARRVSAAERDERMLLIRARAGNRAFWVSLGLTYTGLMWASFAANGSLPELSGDTLWFFLAGAVLVPFIVYIASIVYDQNRL